MTGKCGIWWMTDLGREIYRQTMMEAIRETHFYTIVRTNMRLDTILSAMESEMPWYKLNDSQKDWFERQFVKAKAKAEQLENLSAALRNALEEDPDG